MYNPKITQLNEREQDDLMKKVREELSEGIEYHYEIWQKWDDLDTLTDDSYKKGVSAEDIIGGNGPRAIRSNLIYQKLQTAYINLVTNTNTVKFNKSASIDQGTVKTLNAILEDDYKKNGMIDLKKEQTLEALKYGVSDVEIYDVRDNVVMPKLMNQKCFVTNPDGISGQGRGKHRRGAYRYATYPYVKPRHQILNELGKGGYALIEKDVWGLEFRPVDYRLLEGWTQDMYDSNRIEAILLKGDEISRGIEQDKDEIAKNESLMQKIKSINTPIFFIRHYTFTERGVVVVDINSFEGKIVRYDELKNYDTLPFTTREYNRKPHARNLKSIPQLTYRDQEVTDRILGKVYKNEELRLSQLIVYNPSAIPDVSAVQDVNEYILQMNESSPLKPQESISIMHRSEVDSTAYNFVNYLLGVNEAATGINRQQRGVQPSNQYESATSSAVTAQNAKKSDLEQIFSFIEDDKETPVLIMKRYVSLSSGQFKKVIRKGATPFTISEDILKAIKDSNLDDISVSNKLLDDIEANRIIQNILIIVQQAPAFASIANIDMEELLRWAWTKMGMPPDILDRTLLESPDDALIQMENSILSRNTNEGVPVLPDQNHAKHIPNHLRSGKMTPKLWEHINIHISEFSRQKSKQTPEQLNQVASSIRQGGGVSGPQGGQQNLAQAP